MVDAKGKRVAAPVIYTAPPIVEAVIQINYPDKLSAGAFRKLSSRLERNYTSALASEHVNVNVDFERRVADFKVDPQTRLSSEDEADSLIVGMDSLTWSRLAPYEGWEPFFSRMRQDAEAAYQALGFRHLSRLGVRYVNRLDVPESEGIVRYEDYLDINIALPESLGTVQGYAWRFEKEVSKEYRVIIQSAIAEPVLFGTGAFILDIDVIKQGSMPLKLDGMFAKIEEMRGLKNHYFQVSITDRARESFSR